MDEKQDFCDVCGKPATSSARDKQRVIDPKTHAISYQEINEPRFGCDDHPVTSRYYDEYGKMIGSPEEKPKVPTQPAATGGAPTLIELVAAQNILMSEQLKCLQSLKGNVQFFVFILVLGIIIQVIIILFR